MPSVWDKLRGNNSIQIAIIDSGLDIAHEDIGRGVDTYDNLWQNSGEDSWANPDNPSTGNGIDDDGNGLVDDWRGWDFVNFNNDVRSPGTSHGTHVSGIVSAKLNNGRGISGIGGGNSTNGLQLMMLGVGETQPITSAIDDAILYAVQNGADVIQLSLSVPQTTAIDDAIQTAINNGIPVICASGNNGPNLAVSYPATNVNVIAVGSTKSNDQRSSFSNFGPEMFIAAPGEQIRSTRIGNTYGNDDGTSFAAPQVSAVVGLMKNINPCLTIQQIRDVLSSTAEKVGSVNYNWNSSKPGHSKELGFGRLNANAAIDAIMPSLIGASIICTSQTYQISNLPPGSTVTWSSTWNGAPYPTLVQNSPTANQCTINNTYQYPSTTTLTATINGPCGTRVLTKLIMSESNTQVQHGTYYQEACTFYNTYNPSSSGSLPNTINTPLYLRQGCLTTITLSSMVGKSVTYTGSVQPLYWYYNSSDYKLYLQLPYMSGGIPFTFKITGQGACYEKSLLFFSYSQPYYPSYSFSVSPNPVSNDYLTISATPSEELVLEKSAVLSSSDLEYAVGIIDLTTGETVSKVLNFKGRLEERLDISKLRKGLYSLQIFWKDEIQSIRFLKE